MLKPASRILNPSNNRWRNQVLLPELGIRPLIQNGMKGRWQSLVHAQLLRACMHEQVDPQPGSNTNQRRPQTSDTTKALRRISRIVEAWSHKASANTIILPMQVQLL